jgi:hypothetical protein
MLHFGVKYVYFGPNTDTDKYRLEDSIDDLIKFSLLKRKSSVGGNCQALWIHPLVQVMVCESHQDPEGQCVYEHDPDCQRQLRRESAKKALYLVGTAVQVEAHLRQTSDWAFEKNIDMMTHLGLCCEYISDYFSDEKDNTMRDIIDEELALMVYKLGSLYGYCGRYDHASKMLETAIGLYKRLNDQCWKPGPAALHARQVLAMTHLLRSFLN